MSIEEIYAIGDTDKMRALCGGRIWWLERTAKTEDLEEGIRAWNTRKIIWAALRGAKLKTPKVLCQPSFLHRLSSLMKDFVYRFGIDNDQRQLFHSWLKRGRRQFVMRLTRDLVQGPMGKTTLRTEYDEMVMAIGKAMQPLPDVNDDAKKNLMFSAGLLNRPKMLELLKVMFSQEQQFSLLEQFLNTPISQNNREQLEEVVDLLLCSILKMEEKHA